MLVSAGEAGGFSYDIGYLYYNYDAECRVSTSAKFMARSLLEPFTLGLSLSWLMPKPDEGPGRRLWVRSSVLYIA